MEGEEGDVGAWARRGANMRPRKAAGVAEAVLGAAPLAAAARAAAVEPASVRAAGMQHSSERSGSEGVIQRVERIVSH
eukprot:scaffold14369_cov19-Tisochrysis_lutea.AAC.3